MSVCVCVSFNNLKNWNVCFWQSKLAQKSSRVYIGRRVKSINFLAKYKKIEIKLDQCGLTLRVRLFRNEIKFKSFRLSKKASTWQVYCDKLTEKRLSIDILINLVCLLLTDKFVIVD